MSVSHTYHVIILSCWTINQSHDHRGVTQTNLLKQRKAHISQTVILKYLFYTQQTNMCKLKCIQWILCSTDVHRWNVSLITESPMLVWITFISYPYVLELFHRCVTSSSHCSKRAQAFKAWLFPGDEKELVSYRCNDSELHCVVCVYWVEMAAWENIILLALKVIKFSEIILLF